MCVHARVVWGRGGWRYLHGHVHVCMHVCTCFDDPQMGPADAEMPSAQRFQALALLRNDVHLEDCHALCNTCEPVDSYCKRFGSLLLCLLLWE